MAVLMVLTLVGAASIGIRIAPTLIGMLISIFVWRWPWVVAAVTVAGLAASVASLLSAGGPY